MIKEKSAESIEPSDLHCSGNKSLYLYFKLTSIEKKGNFEGTIPHDNWTFDENRYDYVEQLKWAFLFFATYHICHGGHIFLYLGNTVKSCHLFLYH